MTPLRGRAIALWSAGAAIVALTATGLAVRSRIEEEWHLWRLDTGRERKRATIDRLGQVGGERAFLRLHEIQVEMFPECIMQRGNSIDVGNKRITVSHHSTLLKLLNHEDVETFNSVCRATKSIGSRIGIGRGMQVFSKWLIDRRTVLRVKVWTAQYVILASTDPEHLPEPVRSIRKEPAEESEQHWSRFRGSKKTAIKALIPVLRAPDTLCRSGSAYALGWCGPDAMEAVPALEEAARDSDEDVRLTAQEALRKIRGE